MANGDKKQSTPEGRGGKKPRRGLPPMGRLPQMPRADSFWVNLATSVLVLLLLAATYTYFTGESTTTPKNIPLSQLAADINAGLVASIEVDGNNLNIIYADKTEKKSKKEPEAALSQTLSNYNVDKKAFAKVSIDIKREGGWQFWLSRLGALFGAASLDSIFCLVLEPASQRCWDAGVFLRPEQTPRY